MIYFGQVASQLANMENYANIDQDVRHQFSVKLTYQFYVSGLKATTFTAVPAPVDLTVVRKKQGFFY